MKKILFLLVLIFLINKDVYAQSTVYLPIITKDGKQIMEYPILSISNGTDTINLLDPGSGLQMDNPYWQPNIAQLKSGGTFVNPSNADGQALVSANYDNVIETIPLRIVGPEGYKTVENLRRVFQMSVNAQNYYTASFEQNQVYMAVKAKGDNFLTGYSAVYTMSISNISNPFGTPFVNDIDYNQFDTVNLVINREPFFSPLPPCEQIGPLYDVVRNSDFELWNFGIADSQPDSWDDWESNTTGTNNRSTTNKFGNYALNVEVTDSSGAGYKGIQQTITDYPVSLKNFTIVASIQARNLVNANAVIKINDGVTDVYFYQSSNDQPYILVADYFQHSVQTTLTIQAGIETLGANASGTVYIDDIMLLDGDFEDYANNNLLAYLNSSMIVNHWDSANTWTIEAGDLNWVDIFNVPGDIESKSNLQIINNTEPPSFDSVAENVGEIWAGLRKRGDILNFANYLNFSGTSDNTCASNSKLVISVTSSWQQIGTFQIDGSNNVTNFTGRYRLLIRVADRKISPSNLQFRVRYYAGTQGPTDIIFEPPITPRGDSIWEVLELTNDNQLIEYDTNFTKIGYIIEVKRNSGSDNAEFDYSALIPTEEYVNLETNIPISLKLGLDIKNTCKERISISQILTENYWQKILDFEGKIYASNIYRDELVFADQNLDGIDEFFTTFDGNVTKRFSTTNTDPALQIAVDSNNLYFGTFASVPDPYAWQISVPIDNNVVVDIGDVPGPPTLDTPFLRGAVVYNGIPYFSMVESITHERIITKVVNTVTTVLVKEAGSSFENDVRYIFELNGFLYTGTLKYDIANDTVIDVTTAESSSAIGVFNGHVVYGIKNSTQIDIYDGNTYYANVFNMQNNLDLTLISDPIAILNNTLYLIDSSGVLYSTDDLETWETVNQDAGFTSKLLISYNNTLYAVSDDNELYKFIVEEGEYNTQDYTGKSFNLNNRTLTNEKRQRLFTVQNRFNGSNVIDDKMIVGIGYRPLYFSLINKDDF